MIVKPINFPFLFYVNQSNIYHKERNSSTIPLAFEILLKKAPVILKKKLFKILKCSMGQLTTATNLIL